MLTIRPARSGDIPAIAAIYQEAVRTGTASWELEPPTEAEMLRRFETITGGGYPYLVAEMGGTLAGYAYASAYRPRLAYRFTVENSIYVDPARQGQGIGRRLLQALIDDCARRGFRQMVAVIGDSGNLGSRKLHAALGFTLIGVAPALGYKFDRWLDQVLMQRALGDGEHSAPGELSKS
ncbi:GNAT family N-acetyltransferase [Pleomorphomonas carboxyditropha]|uniref:GNAT family N-acetyltransferase n=1 Tax=Pleomorphomonas carboxyditropha TaxID=2023338 RepID=A0A2G9WVM1_9HYPH|nr:GNAT family N-acetyltransferase [Pleomorphomonas carboxyditropha]PIO98352.1 GNAT family N-acetyltransferase [Pleomorphomonas carboxyditropha]